MAGGFIWQARGALQRGPRAIATACRRGSAPANVAGAAHMARQAVVGRAAGGGSDVAVGSPYAAPGAAAGQRVSITHGDALAAYPKWKTPVVIVSDGPYGLGMFDGDPYGVEGLADFYGPHVIEWSKRSTNQTTLWFWCTEIGWATVHPVLERHGWRYTSCHVWNKGLGHIAGNVNTRTISKFPVVTEVCVQYVMDKGVSGVPIKDWLRSEWERTGLPLCMTNAACGLKNAATRKYLTRDRMWYIPPPTEFEKISRYANRHGIRSGRPYFSLDDASPAGAEEWSRMRAMFRCPVGVTNVWSEPPLHGGSASRTDRHTSTATKSR